jgi:hypothetical protein
VLIVLDYKKSIIQFSYCNKNECSLLRGVYFAIDNPQFSKDIFFLEVPFVFKDDKKIKDFRYNIKNKFELNLYKTIIILLNKIKIIIYTIKKIINNKIFKVIFNTLLIFISLFTFYSLIGGSYFKNNYSSKNNGFLVREWISFIDKFASVTLHNSQGFINGKLAIINGINDYQVLLVKYSEENTAKNIYIAVYYNNIVFIDKNNNSFIVRPNELCKIGEKEYFIYKLSAEKKILIFNNHQNFELKNISKYSLVLEDHITGFLKNKNLSHICKYLVLN